MVCRAWLLVAILACASCKYVPRFHSELSEEERGLLRSAYDSPPYDLGEHQDHDEDLALNKLDLLKDSAWAIKAKLKEVLAFESALKANVLASKLKLQDLLKNHLGAIEHHHHVEHQPVHYQTPVQPQYAPTPVPQQYVHAPQQYAHAPQQYAPAPQQYAPAPQQYAPAPQQYAPAPQQYQYGATRGGGAGGGAHDPYYGH